MHKLTITLQNGIILKSVDLNEEALKKLDGLLVDNYSKLHNISFPLEDQSICAISKYQLDRSLINFKKVKDLSDVEINRTDELENLLSEIQTLMYKTPSIVTRQELVEAIEELYQEVDL